MRMTGAEFIALQARLDAKRKTVAPNEPVERESDLHDEIIQHCNSQWPRWKFIRGRMDKRSTIAIGAQDFTIFLPGGRLLCVECKRRGAKPTTEQLAWHKEMELLGHRVYVIQSVKEFYEAAEKVSHP